MKEKAKRLEIVRIINGIESMDEDYVINEVPMAFIYNGKSHVIMMCTPSDLEDLVYGFSFSEGIIQNVEQIYSIQFVYKEIGIEAHIEIDSSCALRLDARKRQMSARTGCGICGLDALQQVERPLHKVTSTVDINLLAVEYALDEVASFQELNKQTGASHAVFCCEADGVILAGREDVGRHVAMDKLTGYIIKNKINTDNRFCLTTSRASFEMVQKAICANFRLLVAISAPTYMAINLAKKNNLKLMAFSRVGRINVYSS